MRGKNKVLQGTILAALVAVLVVAVAWTYVSHHKKTTASQTFNPQTSTKGQNESQAGGVTDNNSPAPSPSSAAGAPTPTPGPGINVASPAAGSKLANGSVVSGTDLGYSTVGYRIVDNSAGVLTTGQLNVSASGRFSGTVGGLQPASHSGYIEFFNTDPKTLRESGNVKVQVVF